MSFGQRLRGLRRDLDLSQSALADRAGCSVNTVRKLESDQRRPSRELASRLSEVLELAPHLRSEFLRLARGTQSVGRPSLPTPMTRLIGREVDIARVREQLLGSDVRLLTLVGPPGVGKTRLALQVATQLQDVFRDGAAFVALAAVRDPALVVESIAQTLGVTGTTTRPLGQTLVEHLRARSLLLVLDNFEQVMSAREHLPVLLASAPELKVLVTSREALAIYGEHVYVVPTLELPDRRQRPRSRSLHSSPAELLFLERARAARQSFAVNTADQSVVADICVRLEELPLAIELAASRARSLGAQSMLEQLGHRLDLLSSVRGSGDASQRQRSMRGALDWSYDLLDECERSLFCRLAVFSGGATLEAIAAIGGGDVEHVEAEVRPAVEDLAEKSLLLVSEVAGGTRFEMLETIREYAHERLIEVEGGAGERVLRRRHAEHFATMADMARAGLRGANELAWLQLLDADHDNLRAALRLSLQENLSELTGRLCAGLWPFWRTRGHLFEGRRWLAAALAPGAALPRSVRAGVCNAAGVLALIQNDYAEAAALLAESRDLYAAQGDTGGVAFAASNLGWLAHDCNDTTRARSLFNESLSLRREIGDEWGEASSLNNLGMLALEVQDISEARELFSASARLYHRIGSATGLAQALSNLAWAEQELGHYGRARDLFSESLALAQRLEDARGAAHNISNLALMSLYEGDYSTANDLFVDCVSAFNELGDRRGVAEGLEGLAGVAGVQGRPQPAARLFGVAEALREAIGAPLLPADHSRYESMVAAAREQLEAAAWTQAWAEGRATPVEETVRRLLE